MKLKITFLSLVFSAAAFAQAPASYYNNATGTGYTLKTQLKTIITNDHDPQPYTTGLWSLYSTALRDHFYENDGSLLDMYSENPTGADPYNFTTTGKQCGDYTVEGDCYNKEHLIPQAYFGGNGAMYSDAHHVVPSDGKVNGWRGNLPFGVVAGTVTAGCNPGATNTPCKSLNNSKIGNNNNSGYSAGYSGKVFEPIDEFKGDIARAFFYFATRYQDNMDTYYNAPSSNNLEVKAMFDGSEDKVFSTTFLNILLTWHNQDPVSAKEIAFNNSIYTFQKNRNPFIDRPQYVAMIWGTPAGTDSFDISSKVSVYPNPSASHTINILSDIEITSIRLISINGQVVAEHENPLTSNGVFTLNNLPQGFYILTITSPEGSTAKKVVVN